MGERRTLENDRQASTELHKVDHAIPILVECIKEQPKEVSRLSGHLHVVQRPAKLLECNYRASGIRRISRHGHKRRLHLLQLIFAEVHRLGHLPKSELVCARQRSPFRG